jgi:hypothetical protein
MKAHLRTLLIIVYFFGIAVLITISIEFLFVLLFLVSYYLVYNFIKDYE